MPLWFSVTEKGKIILHMVYSDSEQSKYNKKASLLENVFGYLFSLLFLCFSCLHGVVLENQKTVVEKVEEESMTA